MVRKGIDISSHQGIVDFSKVKAVGYDFVIIKAGQGFREFQTFKKKQGYLYQPKAEAAGMDWGAYWWSDAVTVSEAKQEARSFVEAVKGLHPTFPLYIDQEYDSPPDRLGMSTTAIQLRTDMIKAFTDIIRDAGYLPGLYTSTDWLINKIYDAQLTGIEKWVAQYANKCTYKGDYGMWQHHGDMPGFIGHVDGIIPAVDLNDCYKDYPTLINGQTSTTIIDWGQVGGKLKEMGYTSIKL